jgi:hypothetical protein
VSITPEQPDQLLEERRVAAGHLDRGLRGLVGQILHARQQVAEHLLGVVGLEVAQVDPLVIDRALAPARRVDQHDGPRRGEQHDRRAAQPADDLADQAERVAVGPLHVVEHEHQR